MAASITIELKISTTDDLNEAQLLELIKDEFKGGWILGGPEKKHPIKFKVNP